MQVQRDDHTASRAEAGHRNVVRHRQTCVVLTQNSWIILGSGPLFRHVNPDGYMWSEDGDRTVEVFVPFEKTIPRAPMVQLNLVGLDASKAQNVRLKLEVGDVSPRGFVAVAKTWGDTRIASVDAAWFAIAQTAQARVARFSNYMEGNNK